MVEPARTWRPQTDSPQSKLATALRPCRRKGRPSRASTVLAAMCARLLSGGVVLDEVLNHRWVRKGRGVTQVAEVVLRDLAKDPAHDLARPSLGQARRPLDDVR